MQVAGSSRQARCPTFTGALVVAARATDGDLDVLTGAVHCTTGRVYTLRNEGMG